MKKSILKLSTNAIKNTQTIKGGQYGTGTRSTASSSGSKPELL